MQIITPADEQAIRSLGEPRLLAAPAETHLPARAALSNERVGRLLAGLTIVALSLLARFQSPLWLIGMVMVGVNLAQSGVTEQCLIKRVLLALGFRCERDLGRAEAEMAVRRLAVTGERSIACCSKVSSSANTVG